MSGGGGSDSRWLVSYADLVTLLMAFFIALYGISHSDQKKFNDFLKGLGAFGNPAAANSGILNGGPSIVGSGSGVGAAAAGKAPVSPTGSSGQATAAAASTQQAFTVLEGEIEKALAAVGLTSSVKFTLDSRGLVATIATDQVLFQTGSSQVSGEGQKIIGAIAPALTGIPNQILVEGHTDNVPLHANGYTNWNLSTDRAVAVLQLLQASFGIDPSRLSGAGYGEYHPVASNDTAAGRALNRRVEIVILSPVTPVAAATPGTGVTSTATPLPAAAAAAAVHTSATQ